ncbi:hypothetical protein SAMN05216275_1412 [Streptosporangium canum]|uniref:Uncharacterized protein n=1 Tax=Streptosporangium canum TaxID=324952 RepID=A0A1I4DCL1_9ACTN|nr:hypothetical protein SAMN05216275_1412 [Streptosporangium canum]
MLFDEIDQSQHRQRQRAVKTVFPRPDRLHRRKVRLLGVDDDDGHLTGGRVQFEDAYLGLKLCVLEPVHARHAA